MKHKRLERSRGQWDQRCDVPGPGRHLGPGPGHTTGNLHDFLVFRGRHHVAVSSEARVMANEARRPLCVE